MTGNSKSFFERASFALIFVGLALFCVHSAGANAHGQIPPKQAPPKPQPQPSPRNRERHRPVRVINTSVPRESSSGLSDNFVALGDQFAETSKWNAAEAAYNEAIKLQSGNADAWAALGYLFVDQSKFGEAYRAYNRLRGMSSGYADDLLSDIKRKQSSPSP